VWQHCSEWATVSQVVAGEGNLKEVIGKRRYGMRKNKREDKK
jgi:hypothetical protein